MVIGIAGAGIMGSGIAQVASMAGYEVRLYDISSDKLSKALNDISLSLAKFAAKGQLHSEGISEIIGRIYLCETVSSFSGCQLIIEAVAEDINVKKSLLNNIESMVSEECLISTNTSSLSVTSLASSLKNPQRFLGIHFFNPVVLMPLCEVVPCIQTKENCLQTAIKVIESWGKTVVIAKDTPGFIVNKVARPFYSEALRILEEGIADIITIDKVMKKAGFKMGPFELMDFIGHDVNYRVTESIWSSYYFESRYKPSFTQLRLVEAGYHGKKSGKGFYDYPIKETSDLNISDDLYQKISIRILSMLINEAADTLYFGICNEDDLEKSMRLGLNYPFGLIEWGKNIGFETIVKTLDDYYNIYHEERYRASILLRNWIL